MYRTVVVTFSHRCCHFHAGSKYATGTTFGHLNRQINKPKLLLNAKHGFNAHRFIINNVNVKY